MVEAAKGNETLSDHDKLLASVMAPPEPASPSRAGSIFSFKPKPYNVTLGDAGGSSNGDTKSYPHFPYASSYLAANGNPSKGNPIPNEQTQLAKLVLGARFDLKMDPKKLRKIISNRLSAQRTRDKKAQYVSNLEKQVQTFQDKVAALSTKVASYTYQKHLLTSEQTNLRKKLEAIEKEKSLKSAETEKSNAELKVLRELQTKQLEEQFGAPIFNWNASPQPIYGYPNEEPENGREISEMKVEIPPNQEEVHIHANINMDQQAPNMIMPSYPGWVKF